MEDYVFKKFYLQYQIQVRNYRFIYKKKKYKENIQYTIYNLEEFDSTCHRRISNDSTFLKNLYISSSIFIMHVVYL